MGQHTCRERQEREIARVGAQRPDVKCRPATPEETPRGAATLVKTAEAHGWRVRVTYARGPHVLASGKYTGRTIDSIAVRLRHPDGRAAVAVWHDGKTDCAFTWRVPRDGTPGTFPRKVKVTEVKRHVAWGDDGA